ncbi:Oligosaccharyltransferase 48 kDa subunit beta-domain-containing protein [Armillaria nabsnona]|nr:Oligosaccharyltransferase 48 kDa subunit beta-domain-containing protein [Armillaria nabsnona]
MTDPNLAYEPLEGAVLRENPDSREFDQDSLNDDEELELWLTHVPGNKKTKYVENITIKILQGSLSVNIDGISWKLHSYNIWSVGNDDGPRKLCCGLTDTLADTADKDGKGLWAGCQLGVVSGFQALSDAYFFCDKFMNKKISKGVKSGNTQFEDAREPYSDIKDMRLEFTKFDPYIRTALPPVAGKPGIYSTQFCAPDWHGVVKFVVDYKHEGIMAVFNVWLSRWMHLHHSITVAVMPPWHDEYLRFLGAAWPYYAGAISTSVGFLFSVM